MINKLKEIAKRLQAIRDQMHDPYLGDDFDLEIDNLNKLILFYEDDGK
jgi:hypothetical protein